MKLTLRKVFLGVLCCVVCLSLIVVCCLMRHTVLTQDAQSKELRTELTQANINASQAVELLQRPTWYWVAPGVVSSTLDGTGTRVDYNSGISLAIAQLHHPLSRNMSYPRKLAFVRNVNHSAESVCGGLLTVSEVN